MEFSNARKSVLLVDDSMIELTMLSMKLEKAGFRVEKAKNGLEGLKELAEKPGVFSAVISDVQMPNLDGLEFVAEARKRGVVVLI